MVDSSFIKKALQKTGVTFLCVNELDIYHLPKCSSNIPEKCLKSPNKFMTSSLSNILTTEVTPFWPLPCAVVQKVPMHTRVVRNISIPAAASRAAHRAALRAAYKEGKLSTKATGN